MGEFNMPDKPPGMGLGFDEPIKVPDNKPRSPIIGFESIQPVKPLENKARAVIPKSPNNYIAYVSDKPDIQGVAITIGRVDIVHIGRVTAYCAPSEEAVVEHQGNLRFGQDAATVVLIGDNYELVGADGVGQYYMSELASQDATTAIAANPSTSLARNLLTAADSLQHLELPEPNTGTPLTDEALRKTRDEEGSETMLNQLSVNSNTGRIDDGLILGDGGFSILRANGQREHYPPADKVESESRRRLHNKLSTKRGMRGQPLTLKDLVGQDIVLANGDTVLLYTDSLQHKIGEVMFIEKFVISSHLKKTLILH